MSKLARAGIEFLKIQLLTCIDQIKAGNVWSENDQKSAAINGSRNVDANGHPNGYPLHPLLNVYSLLANWKTLQLEIVDLPTQNSW